MEQGRSEMIRHLVAAVLDSGRAVRLFHPQIDSVAFISRWSDAYRDFYLFTEGSGGEMEGLGTGPQSHARFADLLLTNGYDSQAAEYLSAVVAAYPEDRQLRFLYGLALSKTGEPAGAARQLKAVIESGPADHLGEAARALLRNPAGERSP